MDGNILVASDDRPIQFAVQVMRRADGGLRVWSDDIPGFVLSNRDPDKVLNSMVPVLQQLLAAQLGYAVKVESATRLESAGSRFRAAYVRRARRYWSPVFGARPTCEYFVAQHAS